MTSKPANKSELYPVLPHIAMNAHIGPESYAQMHDLSLNDTASFWDARAKEFIDWEKHWDTVNNSDFSQAKVSWFEGARLNVCYNCVDRHLEQKADDPALIWESDDPAVDKKISYRELHEEVCRFANGLKALGVEKGDCVSLYLTMIPEAVVAMLACARIGAIHSVIFAGLSVDSVRERIADAQSKVIITVDEFERGGECAPSKRCVDDVCQSLDFVEHVVVVKTTMADIPMQSRDVWYHDLVASASIECAPVFVEATHPLFILYTSGSTGKPKGIVHSSGGYLVYTAVTFKYIFDYHDGDIFWSAGDIGWITGHSYGVYGALANGASSVIYQGCHTYPDYGRYWRIIEKHGINIFYTAPTILSALKAAGDTFVSQYDLSSLRVLGSVGEAIHPSLWQWYFHTVGQGRCPIVDTWWQTETGGILISPLPGVTDLKAGSVAQPFFGINPVVIDDGQILENGEKGQLVFAGSWPGQMIAVFGDEERFRSMYFDTESSYYLSGDSARKDEDGCYWIAGRQTDQILLDDEALSNVDLESALTAHEAVADAAVVGHDADTPNKNSLYAFVALMPNIDANDVLILELKRQVFEAMGETASLEYVQFVSDLPKTRSGKILRRFLRQIATNEISEIGDASTVCLNHQVIDEIIQNRIFK